MSESRRRRTRFWRGVRVSGVSSAFVLSFVAAAGYFDADPVHIYPAKGTPLPIAAVNFSGDMGLRFLLGATTSRGLTERGIPVVGISTPAPFRFKRTRAEVDAIIADGIRVALARTGVERVVVIGQSYGADVVQTGLADLPADLRAHVAGIILILPGETVFYRADPTGLVYKGTPDSLGVTTARTLTWAPLTCIYGQDEDDSLCPHLRQRNVRLIGMPGDHDIKHDADGLLAHVIDAIERAVPGLRVPAPRQG